MRVRGSLISVVRFLCALSLALALAVIAVPAASAITTIVQGPSTSGTVSVAGSAAFTDTLSASSGSSGPVTFVASGESSPTGLAVNSTGNGIVTTGTLAANTYTISGNDSDGSGDTGTWTYTLDVTASTIVQGPSTSGSVSVAGSATFTDTLSTSSGSTGAVTFVAGGPSSPAGLAVNSTHTGIVTSGTLPANSYTISGTDSDSYGDTGTWSFSLDVTASTIVQGPATSGSVSVAGSAAFTDALSASSGSVGAVSFVASGPSSPAGLAVNSAHSGIVTSGTLPANSYTISGSDSDGSGDTGTWTYTLDVTASTIVQGPSTSGSVSVAGSATFTANLSASSGSVGSVTFTATSAASGLVVTGSQISTTGTLDVGVHSISGTDVDAYGDTGSWSYSLNVTGTTLTQTSPTSASTTTRASSSFNPGSLSVSGATGPVVYVLSVTSPALSLAGGQISTTGSLGAGNYTISGTVGDSYGDVGTWTYTLSVASVGGNTLVQTSSSAATTTTKASQAFGPVSIIVDNNDGPVTFQTTVPSSGISVSSGGSIETTGTLTAGVYTASGTDSDLHGDSGTWTFTLTVTGVVTTVTFDANGGTGTMAPESDSSPSPLTLNTFVRTGYSFVDWNTSPNGSGVRYANGAVYSFGTSETLFAQWKVGKAPSFTVTFAANGGVGTMPPETNNTPTALSANGFTRAGYTFVGWNSNPNGTGTSFGASATYSFKAAVTLYAQWRKTPTFTVRFAANGGRGTMRSETRSVPTALSANRFTRAGYTFVGWNTAANRGGVAYRAGATYPFSSSTTLYAEWNKVKSVVPPPAIDASASFGPFAAKSFSLTTALESQIAKVAQTAKVDRDTEIALVGYGDTLTPANELNEELWSKNIVLSERRVNAVDVYLRRILDSMGLKGVAISTSAAGASSPSGTRQSKSGVVVAALS